MFIFGRKKKSASIYQKRKLVTVTFVDITGNYVAKKMDTDDNALVYVGFEKKKHPNKPQQGVFGDVVPALYKECQVTKDYAEKIATPEALMEQAKEIKNVNIVSTSKGKGFAGVMKRHGFKGLKATHGIKDTHRLPGSIGTQGMDRVMKGRKMPGRMGSDRITMKNRPVLGVQQVEDRTYMIVKGTIPGGYNAVLQLTFNEAHNESEASQPAV